MIDFGFIKDPYGHYGNAPENPFDGDEIQKREEEYFTSRLTYAILAAIGTIALIAIALILYGLLTS